MTLKREITQIVEIDITRCSLTYGVAPCTASLGVTGVRKCYNCFFSSGTGTATTGCQDQDNFTASTETLRFAENVDGLPRNERIYPVMAGRVTTNPTKINLGGVGDKSGPLGKRARISVKFNDFQDSDIWFDRYQAERVSGAAQTDEGGYNPQDRGTFFAKLRRRYPYYVGKPLRVLEGEVGQPLASMRTRNYIITEWKGPDAGGNVEITAKDILDLADNKKALAPAASSGKLASAIDSVSLATFDLLPAGVGSEYAASGRASLGSEVVSYTRSVDTITLTGRGLDGTDAASHGVDALFQQAYRVDGASIADTANDLLVNYAGVDASFINLSNWQAEVSRWMAGFNLTATITKPTGVSRLLGELSQLGVVFWWDDINQEIGLRANRPLDFDETAPVLSDDKTFIEKTIGIRDLDAERLSRVLFWHGQDDVSGSATNGNNFSRAVVDVDASAETANEFDQVQLIEIFNRWLGDGNDSIAGPVARRLLNRYRNTPQEVTFTYDSKDAANVELAQPVDVNTRLLVDETGKNLTARMQVTSVEEIVASHRLRATVQSYQFDGRYGFITENSRPDYAASSDAQKAKGTYIADEVSLVFGDGTGPYLMF